MNITSKVGCVSTPPLTLSRWLTMGWLFLTHSHSFPLNSPLKQWSQDSVRILWMLHSPSQVKFDGKSPLRILTVTPQTCSWLTLTVTPHQSLWLSNFLNLDSTGLRFCFSRFSWLQLTFRASHCLFREFSKSDWLLSESQVKVPSLTPTPHKSFTFKVSMSFCLTPPRKRHSTPQLTDWISLRERLCHDLSHRNNSFPHWDCVEKYYRLLPTINRFFKSFHVFREGPVLRFNHSYMTTPHTVYFSSLCIAL